MSGVATAIVGSAVIGGYFQGQAAEEAAGAQTRSSEAQIAETRRQFDEVRRLLQPYVEAGAPALQAQQAMLGLGGVEAERAQIAAVERSPTFQALLRQGEESLLQRASATGGLRGGNVQAALAQFRPALLAQELGTRYERLGGLTSLGQRSAAGVGAAGMESGQDISTALGAIGSAQAGQALAQGQAFSNIASSVPNALVLSRMLSQPQGTMVLGGGF
jgi:hypothetical protein